MKTMKRMVTPILCVGFAGILGAWQGPLYDTVTVDLPFEVRVQDQVLKPGEYRIQEQRSAADTGVLLIYDNEGTEFKTSVMTIDTMDKKTPEDTKVVLQQIGDDYYFDKVWIQGKNYGYEFVLPESVRSRQREVQQSRNLPARWERSEGLSKSMTQPADAGKNLAGDASRTQTSQADRTVAVTNTRLQERLIRQVRHELVMLPYYGVFDHFAYRVDGDTVTLMGQVTRPTLKSSAENVVKQIEGVERVENNIEVLPVSPNDDNIRLAAYRAIYGHTALNRYALQAVPPIHIIVNNGNVTLEGVVANQSDKNIAGMQANSVPGAFSVTNNLRVEQGS